MPKTFTNMTVANATAGNAILASDFSSLFTTINNHTVPPAVQCTLTGTQTAATGVLTTMSWTGSNTYDTDSVMHEGVTNPSRITINTAGLYVVSLQVRVGASTVNAAELVVTRNGGNRIGDVSSPAATNFSLTFVYAFSAADYIQASFFHTAGSTLTFDNTSDYTRFNATWIGKTS